MLRFFVLFLVLLNGVYFAWVQGFLLDLSFAPVQQREPQRLSQQIHPEAVRLLNARELRLLENAPRVAQKPAECLQAGLFDEHQGTVLRQGLEALTLPAGAWTLEAATEPARWIVYMGKYASADAMAKKRAELASLKLKFEPLRNPELEIGLSLGGFETKADANDALAALVRRGVRTARVVQEQIEVRGVMLRLPAIDDNLRARLSELEPALADKALSPCR